MNTVSVYFAFFLSRSLECIILNCSWRCILLSLLLYTGVCHKLMLKTDVTQLECSCICTQQMGNTCESAKCSRSNLTLSVFPLISTDHIFHCLILLWVFFFFPQHWCQQWWKMPRALVSILYSPVFLLKKKRRSEGETWSWLLYCSCDQSVASRHFGPLVQGRMIWPLHLLVWFKWLVKKQRGIYSVLVCPVKRKRKSAKGSNGSKHTWWKKSNFSLRWFSGGVESNYAVFFFFFFCPSLLLSVFIISAGSKADEPLFSPRWSQCGRGLDFKTLEIKKKKQTTSMVFDL